jgi:hypothetical protein
VFQGDTVPSYTHPTEWYDEFSEACSLSTFALPTLQPWTIPEIPFHRDPFWYTMCRDCISFRQDSVRDRGYSAFELSIAVQIILPSPATSIFPEKKTPPLSPFEPYISKTAESVTFTLCSNVPTLRKSWSYLSVCLIFPLSNIEFPTIVILPQPPMDTGC